MFAIAIVSTLCACQRDDPAFGESYDACILKYATPVDERSHVDGDSETYSPTDERLDTVTDICSRHFIRKPTLREAQSIRNKSTVYINSANIITASINNTSGNVIIKEVKVTIHVYKNKTNPIFDPGKTYFWELTKNSDGDPININPGQSDYVVVNDNLNGKRFTGYVEPTKVLPRQ